MNGHSIPDDIEARLKILLQQEGGENDPAVLHFVNKFKAQIEDGRLSPATARQLLDDDAKTPLLIEKARQELAAIDTDSRAAPAPASVPPSPIDVDLAKALLAGQAEMRAELFELRSIVTELKAATHTAIAATTDLKDASQTIQEDVKTAISQLSVGSAWRTALWLTPLTLIAAFAGNKLTAAWDAWQWNSAPLSAPKAPVPPVAAPFEGRFWTIAPPRDEPHPQPRPGGEPAALMPSAPRARGRRIFAASAKVPT